MGLRFILRVKPDKIASVILFTYGKVGGASWQLRKGIMRAYRYLLAVMLNVNEGIN